MLQSTTRGTSNNSGYSTPSIVLWGGGLDGPVFKVPGFVQPWWLEEDAFVLSFGALLALVSLSVAASLQPLCRLPF